MTQTTETVFQNHEIRKTREQKSDFIRYVQTVAKENGYRCTIQEGAFGSRNIIVGSPETAKVIYTAHYDTCAGLPFPNFITPKNILLYLLYQTVIAIQLLVYASISVFLAEFFLPLLSLEAEQASLLSTLIYEIVLIGSFFFIIFGPANRHTANDNTSGVTTLLDLMLAMPAELRSQTAFVFFDFEEVGMIGSMCFAKKYKNAVKNKPLVNFDCVSDGDHILFAVKKTASRYIPLLKEAYKTDARVSAVDICSEGVFYPSDQMNFSGGIGVAAMKRTQKGLLYMNRIHTSRDTVYREENIRFLTEGSIRLAQLLTKKSIG